MLEITESVLMRDTVRTMSRLAAVRALGVKIAIDDFGTGYSSLSYLPRFPVDVIKIDRAFVKDICDEPLGSTLARTIVELSRRLSLETIAEGVEDLAQAQALLGIGCSGAQGFWFAPARPIAETPPPGSVVRPPMVPARRPALRPSAEAWALPSLRVGALLVFTLMCLFRVGSVKKAHVSVNLEGRVTPWRLVARREPGALRAVLRRGPSLEPHVPRAHLGAAVRAGHDRNAFVTALLVG